MSILIHPDLLSQKAKIAEMRLQFGLREEIQNLRVARFVRADGKDLGMLPTRKPSGASTFDDGPFGDNAA